MNIRGVSDNVLGTKPNTVKILLIKNQLINGKLGLMVHDHDSKFEEKEETSQG